MNLGINFTTYAKELKSSYQSVLDGNDINWVVYGYDRGNELKVVAKGDGGLEELKEEFDESKIQYAFARVIDPNSDLPKLVLIGWCGEGVPNFKKGFFNSHFNEVTKFLKGYHLQINARSETDVDPDYIMKRINESGGSKYMANVNKDAPIKKDEPILPVRSVYQPEKIPNIAALQKNAAKEPILPVRSVYEPVKVPNIAELQKTASKDEDDEPVRSSYQPEKVPDIAALQRTAPKDEIKPVSSTYKPVQLPKPKKLGTRPSWITEEDNSPPVNVRREKEEREKKERERKDRERAEREERKRLEQEKYEHEERERAERERLEQEEYEREERERLEQEEYEREEHERAEREQEERENEESERTERLRQQREADDRARKLKEREREEKLRQEREKEEYERQELERQQREEEEAYRRQEEEVQLNEESTGNYFARALYDYDAAEDNEMSLVEGEIIKDIVQVDEGWWQGASEDGIRSGLFPANFVELVESESLNPEEQRAQEPEPEPELEPQEVNDQSTLPSAKAAYDYEAGESNEISFVEGDVIINIEFVSDDWWQGTARDGSVGLFPANYVELVE